MYQFSVPMPYEIENINKLIELNTQFYNSKITSMYAGLPSNCELFSEFEQQRNFYTNEIGNTWNYWKKLYCHCLENNIDFIYLLNNPLPLSNKHPDLLFKLEKLDKLLQELKKIGINKIRIADNKLMSHINSNYPYFTLYASTSFEFKNFSEYKYFIFMHPYVKQLIPSNDNLKNMLLLKNLKTSFKDVNIELIVNEGCYFCCPNRFAHSLIPSDNYFTNNFCSILADKRPIHSLVFANNIYPWELEEYKKLGIINFKFVGRDGYINNFEQYFSNFSAYLQGIDDIKSIKNCALTDFIHHLTNSPALKQLTVQKYKKYLPKISHFKKYGHLCSSYCGVQCRYCYECADKIQKVFEKNREKEHKMAMPVCFINKMYK